MATQNSIFEDVEELKEKDVSQDTEIEEIKDKNESQDVELGDLNDEIDTINETLASGGIIVSRRIETNAAIVGDGLLAKIEYALTQKESNDLTIIDFDINNDHIIKRDGDYTIGAGFNVVNSFNQPKTYTLQLIAIDVITSQETIIDNRTGTAPALTTVPINPSFTYTKTSVNNILLVVRQSLEDVNISITSGAHLTVKSDFTIAGSGIATKTTNIAPFDASVEGLVGDEETQSDINMGMVGAVKPLTEVIENDGSNNLNMVDAGRIRNVADPVDNQDVVTKQYFIDNPTGTPYETDKIDVSDVAVESVEGDKVLQSEINIDNVDRFKSSYKNIMVGSNIEITSIDSGAPDVITASENIAGGELYSILFAITELDGRTSHLEGIIWDPSNGSIFIGFDTSGYYYSCRKLGTAADEIGFYSVNSNNPAPFAVYVLGLYKIKK